MKKLLFTSILGVFALGANAQVLHDNCWDHSFAYNYMTIEKGSDTLNISLKGSTIFNLSADSWDSNTSKTFEIPLDQCRFSDDELLVNCNATNIQVIVDRFGDEFDEVVKLNHLNFDISFIESAGWSQGFSLTTRFQPEGQQDFLSSRVVFGGDRVKGCSNNFGQI